MLHAHEVFDNDKAVDIADSLTQSILRVCAGSSVPVALAALFAVFIGASAACDLDPGTEFELMLARVEGRKTRTHGFPEMAQ